jgi:NAD(P)-dependent dehydrogenase (short-subunit alcohol dehydrogenase family)
MSTHDPRLAEPTPPFAGTVLDAPGDESQMHPRPDYGEETYQGSDRLTGRVALITGGDSGIGRAVAVAFAREGADVLISYLSETSDAEETVRAVEKSGRRAIAVRADIGYEAHCQSLVKQAAEELGGLDILVNNAATQGVYESILDIPSSEIEGVFRTNILS